MTKVNINGHSHQVEIDHDGTLREVVDMARELWEQTIRPDRTPPGSGFGLHADRRDSRDLYPSDLDGK